MKKFFKVLAVAALSFSTLFPTIIAPPKKVEAASTMKLSDVPVGSTIVDPTWQWEYKSGWNYSGTGTVKPVEWTVVANNNHFAQSGYGNTGMANHVTVVSKELVGHNEFNSNNLNGPWDSSNIRNFLRGTFYNSMSSAFKNSIVPTQTKTGSGYTTAQTTSNENVFLLSITELGDSSYTSGDDGVAIPYFNSDSRRIASHPTNGNYWYYSRTPYSSIAYYVRIVFLGGNAYNIDAYADYTYGGVRPALNLKSDLSVSGPVNGVYTIVYNQSPTITNDTTNNPTLSEVEGHNKLDISGSIKDTDVGDTLTGKFSIDGTSHIGENITTVIANGTDQPFSKTVSIDPSISEGTHTLRVWGEDDKGGKSTEQVTTFTVDKTAPKISVDNITENQLIAEEVTPSISITDSTNPTSTSLKVDGSDLTNGSKINTSGPHTMDIESTDAVGNKSNKTVHFTINKTPIVTNVIDNQMLKKFEKLSFNLSDYFDDVEKDALTFSTSSTDSQKVKATITGNTLELEGMKQGSSVITVKANDGHSDSEILSFNVGVNTRPPELQISNSELVLLDDTTSFTLQGTVKDEDIEQINIKGNVNNIEKSTSLMSTGSQDPWNLTWNGTEFAPGVYDQLKVTAEDEYTGKSELTYPKAVIKVKDSIGRYLPILIAYSADISKDYENFSIQEHQDLLAAYHAVLELDTNNTPVTLADAKMKINQLSNGTVREQFTKILDDKAWEYVSTHLDSMTIADLELSGLTELQPSNLALYQEKALEYKQDLVKLSIMEGFQKSDLQNVILTVNAISKAQAEPTEANWKTVQQLGNGLQLGNFQVSVLQDIQDGVLNMVKTEPSTLSSTLLTDFFSIDNQPKNVLDYQDYLADIISSLPGALLVSDLEDVVSKVDEVNTIFNNGVSEPSKKAITDFINIIATLDNGQYKAKKESQIDTLKLLYLVEHPELHDKEDFDRLGLVYTEANLSIYPNYLKDYVQVIGKESFTVQHAQDILTAIDKSLAAIANPTDQNMKDMLDSIAKIQSGSEIFKDFIQQLHDILIDKINQDPSQITYDQLDELFDNVIKDNLSEYQDNLEEYKKDKGGTLTAEDIQKVIDATNKVIEAEKNPSPETIREALDKVNDLEDGSLKDELLERITNAAKDYIIAHPEDITVEDLQNAHIENVRPELLQEYRYGLGQHQLTRENIQDVINVINQLVDTIQDWSTDNISKLSDLTQALGQSDLKTELNTYVDVLTGFQSYSKDWKEEVLNTVKGQVQGLSNAPYKPDLEQNLTAFDKLITASQELSKDAVIEAKQAIDILPDSSVTPRFTEKWREIHLAYMNSHLDAIDISDLTDLGIDNLNPSYEDDYLKALKQYEKDKGSALSKDDIQLVIDVINGVKKAEALKNVENVNNAMDLIDKLIEGELKISLSEQMNQLLSSLSSSSSSRPIDWYKYVSENPSIVTIDDLNNAGFDNLMKDHQDAYRQGLTDYTKDKGKELTKDEIQMVIDSTNLLQKALDSHNPSDIQKALENITNLTDGSLKDKYSEKVTELKNTIGYVPPANVLEVQKDSSIDMNIQLNRISLVDSSRVGMNITIDADKNLSNPVLAIYYEDLSLTKASVTNTVNKKVLKEIPLGQIKSGNTKELYYELALKEGLNYNISAYLMEGKNKIEAKNSINAKDLKRYLFLEKVSQDIKKK